MKATIEKLLHTQCWEMEFPKINQLPLFLRGAYRFRVIEILSTSFLAAEPVEKINLAAMRKHYFKLMELSGMACAFQLNSISAYTKNKMLEEGIPFVLVGKEVYLPFLGVVLNDNVQSERTPPVRLSFMSQKLLLSALYHNVTQMTVTEMAKLLGVSKMSVTRCFDELDGFQMNLIDDNKTAGRYFKWGKSKKEFWELIRPYLRNPVEKELRLDCLPPWPLPMSGLSAVSHFSMLSDNTYPTYAISKKALKDLQPEKLPQVPQDELPAAIIQVMGYDLLYEGDDSLVIDPLSAILSLTPEETNDPRVESAVEEIMEEFL